MIWKACINLVACVICSAPIFGARHMIVGVDVDGTVADLHTEWLRRYNVDYDDCLTRDKIRSFEIHKYVRPECGKRIYDYLEREDMYDRVPVIAGALEGVTYIAERGARVVYVTTCVRNTFEQKRVWLEVNGFLSDHCRTQRNYLPVGDKSLVRVDMLVDDNPHIAYLPHVITYNQPWNVLVKANRRAMDWAHVRRYFF